VRGGVLARAVQRPGDLRKRRDDRSAAGETAARSGFPEAMSMNLATLFLLFASTLAAAENEGTIAQVYYWKAKPGMLEAYNRYIREVAEPMEAEGGRQGAFVGVTTFISSRTDGAWTHMRVFVLRDKQQLEGLRGALDAAGVRLEPDEAKRRARSEYAATLRD